MKLFRRKKLSPAELLSLDEHLRSCARCQERWNASPEVIAAAKGLEKVLKGDILGDHLSYAELEAYTDGSISSDGQARVQCHLDTCLECREEVDQFRSLAAGKTDAAAASGRWYEPVFSFFSSRNLAFAAVAALLLVVSAVVWISIRKGGPERGPEVSAANANTAIAAISPPDQAVPDEVAPGNATPPDTARTADGDLVTSLRDSGEVVGVSRSGELVGYPTLPPQARSKLENVLRTRDIAVSRDVLELKAQSSAAMGDAGDSGQSFRLIGPIGKVVFSDRPMLSWEAVPGAQSYTVEVYDTNFVRQASSGPLTVNKWTPKLARGKTYVWQVSADKGGNVIKAPARPAPEARFKILNAHKAAEIEAARSRHPVSHLLLGTLYAEAGMLGEALNEFEALANENPRSDLPRKLAAKIRQELTSSK